MSETGKKFDLNKPPLDLVSPTALLEIAKVMGYGAKKYGRFNYRKGLEWSRVISACMRHLLAFNDGEDLDPETQLSHVAHAGANIIMLLEFIKSHPEFDDRYDKDGKAKGEVGTGVSTSREQNAQSAVTQCEEGSPQDKQISETVSGIIQQSNRGSIDPGFYRGGYLR